MSHACRRPVLAAALLATAAAACGPLRRGGGAPPALVIFSNQSLDQADVYTLTRAGARTRIGTVMPGRTDTLRVAASTLGGDYTLTVVARILARSIAPNSGLVTLTPGQAIAITLPPDERMLTVLPVP